MPRRDLSSRDASSRAASELEYVIHERKRAQDDVKTVSAQTAMTAAPVFKQKDDREVTRVLFISRNNNLLNPTQQSLDGYLQLSELFDEVHILIMRQGIVARNPSLRVANNVWIYTASTRFWWQAPAVAFKLVCEQLVFANGFRADLIVARDPFESALVAKKIVEKYHRPAQLHILDDYLAGSFVMKAKNNFWRRFLIRFTMPFFQSVRTSTEGMLTYLKTVYSPQDIRVLPRFQDYESLIDSEERIDLKGTYKPHTVFLLFVGKLDHDSTLVNVLKAARFVLKNPRMALVVLGDGKARSEYKRRAKGLRIEEQVVFENKAPSITPYLKSAHILIVSDTNADSEELVLKAAAAGIPMVLAKTPDREDIFINGVSAYMYEEGNTEQCTEYIDALLNKPEVREKFIANAQEIIRTTFHTDPGKYRAAYRESIEGAYFVEPVTPED